MKSILYLGFAIPEDIQKEVEKYDLLPHYATYKFSWSVVRALKHSFDNIYIISSAEIRNYPASKKLVFKTREFEQYSFNGLFIGFLNLILFKHVSRSIILFFKIRKVLKVTKVDFVMIHGTHTPYMLLALLIKRIAKVRVSILLTDQHGIDVPSDGFLGRLFRRIDNQVMLTLLRRMDAFICLSDVFVKKYELAPSLVVPGILSREFENIGEILVKPGIKEKFTVVFAGGVNKPNGIDLFLEAIKLVPEQNINFVILGNGDLVKVVEQSSINDKRILYGGVKHGRDLIKTLLSGDLLINPRPIHEEFSRTSFPSKLIEYMATGIPTLTTKLESIPKEIEECFFYIEDVTPSSIASSISKIYSLNSHERGSVGERAKNSVRKFYSEETIGQRIHNLITV